MSAIFISHSSRDAAFAGELKGQLAEQGHRSVFLDFDPEDGIPAGRDWERELYARLRACQAVVVLCSEYSMASRWCFAEIALARSLGKALLPLKIGDCSIPAAFTDVQLVDLRADPEAGYRRLWAGLRQAGLDPAEMFDWDGSRSPYPGLMVFQEQDAAIYFGRGAEIQAAVEKLNRMQRLGDGQFAMILGASGSGKSSLLRAGVLPRLKRDRDRWLMPGVFRPLGQPFERLAAVLSAAFKSGGVERSWLELRDRLAQPSANDGAVNLVEQANDLRVATGQREATLLLGVDQFEELLTPAEGDIADRFLALLRALSEQRNSGVIVIGTLRSDFLGSFQNHAALRGLAYEPIDLPQLSVEAFAAVIEGPARLAGLELEPGLAGAIVADAATDDALPLLAFALRELWEARGADGRLTIDRYRNGLGGLQGSVAKAADGLYPKSFAASEDERDIRNSFLSMVRVDASGAYVRRPARWNELAATSHGLLERFVQGRLLVARGEGTDRMLEVAHEALIRRWDKLRGWVEEDREFLRTRERIEGAAAHWLEAGRDASLLLPRGRPLAEAQEMLIARRADLVADVVAFVEASIAVKRSQDEEERKIQRQIVDGARRLARRTLIAAVGVGVLAVLAAGFGWYATKQANEATVQRDIAKEQRNQALRTQSRFLASLSQQETEAGNATNGILLAVEALPSGSAASERPYVPEAEAAFYFAFSKHRELAVLRGHEGPVWSVAFSTDGSRVVTASEDGTARLWDVGTGHEMVVLRMHEKKPVKSAAFSTDGSRVVTASSDGTAQVWDAGTGKEVAVLRGHKNEVKSAVFSADGSRVVTASYDGTARLWDAGTGHEVVVLRVSEKESVNSAVFSTNGSLVVTASNDKTARLWDAVTGKELMALRGHEGWVNSAAFSADGSRVVTASQDGTARLWETGTGHEVVVLRGHEGPIYSAAFSVDRSRVVTASGDGTARLWEAGTGKEVAALRGHKGAVNSAAFSADGSRVVTASEDGTARLWEAGTGKEVAVLGGHEEEISSAVFSADGSRVATASWDGTARLWEAGTGKEEVAVLRGHEGEIGLAALSADGTRVVTVSSDGTAQLWEAGTGKEMAVLRVHEGTVVSAALSADGSRVVTGCSDGTARLWEAGTGKEMAVLRRHDDLVYLAALSADGSRVVTASSDGARLWEAGTGKQVAVLSESFVKSAAFSADGSRVVTASEDGTARLWEADTGKEVAVLHGHEKAVTWAAFSADGSRVVTASVDGTTQLWEAGMGKQVAVLRGHKVVVSSAALSADGSRVVTASDDGTASLWEADTGKEVAVLRGHKGAVNSAAFSADGSRVVTASEDGTARLWDAGTGKEVAALHGHEKSVTWAAFSADGSRVVTASVDGTVRIWRVFPTTEAIIAYAKSIVPRQLTPEERQRYFLDAAESAVPTK